MDDEAVRRPLAGLAAAIALGAWLGVAAPFAAVPAGPVRLGLALAAVFWCAARALGRARTARAAALLAAALSVSFLAARTDARRRMAAVDLFRECAEERSDVVLRGRVASDPVAVALEHGGARLRFDLRAEALAHEAGDIPAEGCRVRVDWYGPVSLASEKPPFPVPRAGEGWQIGGRLVEVPTRAATPLLVLARRERDTATRRAPELDAPAWRLALRDLRAWGARALSHGVDPEGIGPKIVRAMALGYRTDVPPEVSEAFKASGTVHVFAISGLHVGLFAAVLVAALSALGLPPRLRPLVAVPCLAAYVLLTGARPSAVRAGTMALVILCAPLARRRADPATALAFAALVLLAWNPVQILDLGFHLSFVTAGALVLAKPWFDVLLRSGGRLSRLKRISAASLVAWLVSAPITAMCFGRLSPAAIVCNLFVLPLAGAVVGLAIASMALFPILPLVSVFCNRFADLLARAMVLVAEGASAVPGAAWEVEPWSPAAVLLWYAAVLALWLRFRRRLARDSFPE